MYVRRTVSAVDPMRLQAFWNRLQVPWPRSQRFLKKIPNSVLCLIVTPIISFLLLGNACTGVFLETFLAYFDYLRAYSVSVGTNQSFYLFRAVLKIMTNICMVTLHNHDLLDRSFKIPSPTLIGCLILLDASRSDHKNK